MPSSREARFTTGPKTVTFTWSTVPILPATARPVAMPMPTRKSASGSSGRRAVAANSARIASAARQARTGGVGLGQRPSPKAHGRVAVKIAQHAPLLANLVRRHAQRLADAIQQSQQIFGRALRVPRKAAQIAEQHGDLGLARRQHDFRIDALQRLEHDRRKELAQSGPLAFEHPHVAQGAERRGGQFGEFQIVAQVARVGNIQRASCGRR